MSLMDDWGPEDDHDFPLKLDDMSTQELGDISFLFGGVGDLAKRLLVPALYNLASDGFLPENFTVVGTARTKIDTKEYRRQMAQALHDYFKGSKLEKKIDTQLIEELVGRFYYFAADSSVKDSYSGLKEFIEKNKDRRVQRHIAAGERPECV